MLLQSTLSCHAKLWTRLVSILCATRADASNFQMCGLDTTESLEVFIESQALEIERFDIHGLPALHANIVVVWLEVGIELDGIPSESKCAYQAHIREQPQRAIHCVERNGGNTCLDPFEDSVGTGMSLTLCNLSQNFDPLVSQLDPRCLAGLLELIDSVGELVFGEHLNHS